MHFAAGGGIGLARFGQAPSHRRCTINTAIRKAARGALPVAVTASVLAAGLTACGTAEQISAGQKVSKAFGRIGDSKSAGFTLSVDATPEQIVAFTKESGDEAVDEQSAKGLSGLSIAVSVSADKPLKDVEAFKNAGASDQKDVTLDKSVRVSYRIADKKGTPLLEYRQAEATGYLRIDLKSVLKLTGQDPSEADSVTKDLPPGTDPAKSLLSGDWTSFDLQELANEAKKNDGAKGGEPEALPSVDPQAGKELLDSLKDVFNRTVTFEDKGKKDGTEHIWMSAPARQAVDELYKALKPLSTKFPQQFKKFPTEAPSNVPDRKVGADLYLKDGSLSSASFDLAQLAKEVDPGVSFPVKLTFDQETPKVEVPSPVPNKMTTEDLMKSFFLLAAGGDSSDLGDETAPGAVPSVSTDAAPLTDVQLKELAALGLPEAQALNKVGMSFDDLKSIAHEK
ncbi:hypothetical protein [Kitasatospora cathayae]|uniref:Secreted protein n=1 Tax=Kitasatospora cathayae TaxID=3004092 RepID=A0ABY7PX05_9ACTN|nr:hypothetical protein [Kitasatospora sp. HUAS 3-15]WBP84958.1 hypothetical protein O1G21_03245 [Kitasatospora sp. HUAS 3-15]